jgi:hypothetical protein
VGPVEKRGWWEVTSRVAPEQPLSVHIDDVLSLVEPAANAIAALASEVEVWLSCVIYAESAPELSLSVAQVRAVARLGAALDIDVILVSDVS